VCKDPLIPTHGGYRKLKTFQIAQLIYDVTVRFCDRYIEKHSRTHDQMVQAARSGVQNIAEGSRASGASKKTELKLTNVARASLEELRLDYKDFLRQRGLPQWPKDDPRRQELIDRRPQTADDVAVWARELHSREKSGPCGPSGPGAPAGHPDLSTRSTRSTGSTGSTSLPQRVPAPSTYPCIAANAALVLIAVAHGLLGRQLTAQAQSFEQEGGFTERLYARRKNHRRPE